MKSGHAKRLLLLTALFSGILLPLLVNLVGAFAVGFCQQNEIGSPAALSMLQSLLEIAAVFAMSLFSGCLFFAVLFLGQKDSLPIAWIGFFRIVIVYASGLFVQAKLNENFAEVAWAYTKDVVIGNMAIDLLLLLATILLALLFRRNKSEESLRRPLRGLFDFRHPAVSGLLTLVVLLFLVSLSIHIANLASVLSSLSEEERALLSGSEYLLLLEPVIQLLFQSVCGYFLNLSLLSLLLPEKKEEATA